jgi:uncharacterized protein (DUF1015 family)
MPKFHPFRGTRYDPALVSVEAVVAPPYDVISPEQQSELYSRDPHNVIRLILNHDEDPYSSAATFLHDWKVDGVLKPESTTDQFYVYYQTFRVPGGKDVTRTGVIGRLKLSQYDEGEVRPHERTLAGPKRDRLKLFEATKTNLSPIFGLVDDESRIFDQTLELATVRSPLADVQETLPTGAQVRHILWKLDDPMAIDRLRKIVQRGPITIADGHHRYETALAYRDAHPETPGANYVMTYLSNVHGEGTVILPTHRALHGVEDFDQYKFLEKLRGSFALEVFDDRATAQAALQSDSSIITMIELNDAPKFVAVRDNSTRKLGALESVASWRLQEEVLKSVIGLSQQAIDDKTNLLYPHTLEELDTMSATTEIQAAFLLRAVTPAEMVEVVKAGAFMPQKSTFFYPKLLSGLVLYEFANQSA